MKSKIEEKIKNAREATSEMFAAFEKLNEELLEKLRLDIKEGDYFYVGISGNRSAIGIKAKGIRIVDSYCHIHNFGKYSLYFKTAYFCFDEDIVEIRPATPEEIALLDSKLAEQGKRFDKEKLELVDIPKFRVGDWFIPHKPKENKTTTNWAVEMDKFDGVALQVSIPKYKYTENIYSEVADWHFHPDWCEKTTAPKHKEPIIGEMAIFWDTNNKKAFCATLNSMINGRYSPDGNIRFDNAILFESPEQYKAFLKS